MGKQSWACGVGWGGAAFLLVACGDAGAPPFEELEVRDALQASPIVMASLPPASAREVRDRVRAARRTPARDLVVAAGADREALIGDVRRVDEARARASEDALVAYALSDDGDAGAGLRATTLDMPPPGGDDEPEIVLIGDRDPATAALEDAALAGALRGELAAVRRRGAIHFVRVQGWPAAIVVRGDTAYVNATWLVLEAPEMLPFAPSRAAPLVATPGPTARTYPATTAPSEDENHASRPQWTRPTPCGDNFCEKTCGDPTGKGGCFGRVSPVRPASDVSVLFVLLPIGLLVVLARRRRAP